MFKRIVLTLAAASLCMMGACSHEVPYNSNSGANGSRDSAAQIFVNQDHVDDVSAPIGDNEDWYYFVPTEVGTIDIMVAIDSPEKGAVIVSLLDSMGRTLEECSSESNSGNCKFRSLNIDSVESNNGQENRYFIAIKTARGQSAYTIHIGFEPPYVEETPEPEPEPGPEPGKCIPADKCKSGQNCCKKRVKSDPQPPAPTPVPVDDTKPSATGTIVLVTPRTGDVSDIKISGLNKNNAKPGMKAYLRGLKRKVDIYSCMNTSCQATVKATPEELANHDKIDVYPE